MLAKHWEELGKSRNSLDPEQEPELVHESSDLCQEIGWEEVVRVLKTLKRGKAPGPDGILNEMLIYGGSRMVESMRCMFNVMRRSQVYPQDWKSSFVIPLFKDGDPESASNYRGIALGSCVAKVWAKILTVWRICRREYIARCPGRVQGKMEVCRPDYDLEGCM